MENETSTMVLLAILQQLKAELILGRKEINQAVICKRLGLRLSTLQRHLTALASEGIVTTKYEDEKWTTSLTTEGIRIVDEIDFSL